MIAAPSGSPTAADPETQYALVINHGRVIDPETGLDAIRHLGVRDGRIAAISEMPLSGRVQLDATGLVVAPGFIDIHSHSLTPLGQRRNVLDGITTQLETEAGALPARAAGDSVAAMPLINYGASAGHFVARLKVIEDSALPYFFYRGQQASMGSPAFTQRANRQQIATMRALLARGLDEGGLGIGLLLDYMQAAVTADELDMIFSLAGERNVPVFVHVRRFLPGDPTGLNEVLALAEEHGAPVFICHITHSAMGGVGQWLAAIDAARQRGVRVATETLTYLAGGTSIGADVFRERDWRQIFAIDYGDVQWVATGEWLTEERWQHLAATQPGGMVNHHYVQEDWLLTALRWPDMMVSTDALPAFETRQLTNPNISGSFALLLGQYTRDKKILSLSEAVARTSLKQAQWLESFAPVFRRKGRIQEGMDADITVFDPKSIAAVADYGQPWENSRGIHWVIVNGSLTVAEGDLVEGAAAGQYLDSRGSPPD
ncbi:MAG: amidohydrolase family protein [Cellvibrionales bacterium]